MKNGSSLLRIWKRLGFTFTKPSSLTKEGPIFCIYEAKASVSDEEFQKFIDGPEALGVHQGLYPDNPMNNTCMKMDLSLRGGEPPLPRHFTD